MDFSPIDLDSTVQQNLWLVMSTAIIFNAFLNFAYLSWQIVPMCGRKGVFPVAERCKTMRQHFSLKTRLTYHPMQLLNFIPGGYSDLGLRCLTYFGVLLTTSFLYLEIYQHVLGNGPVSVPFSLPAAGVLFGTGGGLGTPSSSSGVVTVPLQIPILWILWLTHAIMADVMNLVFPWHSLISECLFILPVSYTLALFSPSSAAAGGLYSPAGVLAMRITAFRCLFGFGKLKFMGSRKQDWKYIKGFMPSIPVPSFGGSLLYRHMPDVAFLVAYIFFFVSEMIIPFLYFSPVVTHRVVAAGFTFKLMVGIIFSGNFGNFNTLVMAMSIGLPLPVVGHSDELFSSPLQVGLVPFFLAWTLKFHNVMGILVLPFSSWVQSSWWGWTAVLTSAGPKIKAFMELCEILHAYRIVQPYGIFPPNTFAAQRQVPVFEGSNDGKTWRAYRYRHQSSEAHHRPAFCPGVHPIIDFTVFYNVAGFMQSLLIAKNWGLNFEARPIDAVAINLLKGGDVSDCFRDCPFPKTNPPKYIRCRVSQLMAAEASDPNWWVQKDGQMEIPPISLEMLEENGGNFMPKVMTTDLLLETEPALRLWRERVIGRQDTIRVALGASDFASKDDKAKAVLIHMKKVRSQFPLDVVKFGDEVKKCSSFAEVLTYCDKKGYHVGDKTNRQHYLRLAMFAADLLTTCGWPWVGENKERAEKLVKERLEKYGAEKDGDGKVLPVSSYQLYFFCLWLLADATNLDKAVLDLDWAKEQLLKLSEGPFSWYRLETPVDPEQIHDGLKLHVALFPRIIRIESALFRKYIANGQMQISKDDKGADSIIPGYQMYSRGLLQKAIPFFPESYAGLDDALAKKIPGGQGGAWGKELLHHFVWNGKKYEFDYKGVEPNYESVIAGLPRPQK